MTARRPPAQPRRCPACGAAIPAGRLLCREHWFQVPKKLRGDVTRSWNALRLAEGPEDRMQAIVAYRSAADAAIAVARGALP